MPFAFNGVLVDYWTNVAGAEHPGDELNHTAGEPKVDWGCAGVPEVCHYGHVGFRWSLHIVARIPETGGKQCYPTTT